MTKQELMEQIGFLISRKGFTIDRQVIYGKPFGFSVLGTTITLEMPNEREKRAFKNIIEQNENDHPIFNLLGYEDSLEMLFLHYPFSYTNASNCVLLNGKGDVLAIQWNGLNNTVFLKNSSILQDYGCVVINNKWKLSASIKQKDIKNIEEWLNKLIFNNEKVCAE